MISISIKCGRNYPPKRSHCDNDTGNDDNVIDGVHLWAVQDNDDDANDDNEEDDKENDDKML